MSLSKFFSPRSVAVIGASTDPGKLGHAVLHNLVHGGFCADGRKVYPINPKATAILGQAAFPTVEAVPDPIDLAVIVVPYLRVLDALKTCTRKQIPAVVIITAGFREAGLAGLEREQEVLDLARQNGIRLIGPNCLGVIDTSTPLNASFSAGTPPSGPMGFMSQSGALGTAILDWAQAGRLGLSKFVSLGNKADVSEIDLLEDWGKDDRTRVILCYIEGVPDGQAFIDVARRTAKKKPIVAIKSGVTQGGARAVSSHTGSLAGSEQAYQAAFRQAGIVRADTLEDLFDYAIGFGYLPPLRGDRVAIVTNAGGPGILATDALERAGLSLARFTPETLAALKQGLPDASSASNPVDVLGDSRSDRYRFALERVVADFERRRPAGHPDASGNDRDRAHGAGGDRSCGCGDDPGDCLLHGRIPRGTGGGDVRSPSPAQLSLPRTGGFGPQGDEHVSPVCRRAAPGIRALRDRWRRHPPGVRPRAAEGESPSATPKRATSSPPAASPFRLRSWPSCRNKRLRSRAGSAFRWCSRSPRRTSCTRRTSAG